MRGKDTKWNIMSQTRYLQNWTVSTIYRSNNVLPSDPHATARVSIVEKCVQIEQILPTVCSAPLKIVIICLDMNKEVHL